MGDPGPMTVARSAHLTSPGAPPPFQALLKPEEVASRLGVSRSWLYEAAKQGRIPSIRLGGFDGPVRFVESDLLAWIERARAGWQPGDSARDTLQRVVPGRAA